MKGQEANPGRLAKLIESGGALEGFPWPDHESTFDIRIGRDGTWYYQESPIKRLRLCQLFSTVLQRDEAGDYWLVTPGERGRITVDDAPFVAVELATENRNGEQVLRFRTSLDHWVTADADHPLRVEVDPETGEPSPYITFRGKLEALISRPVFYELVDLADARTEAGRTVLSVESAGCRFTLGDMPAD
ncbi:MAG: DUF1285 domain-containing protein [Alphaproteobacteria bacterium]